MSHTWIRHFTHMDHSSNWQKTKRCSWTAVIVSLPTNTHRPRTLIAHQHSSPTNTHRTRTLSEKWHVISHIWMNDVTRMDYSSNCKNTTHCPWTAVIDASTTNTVLNMQSSDSSQTLLFGACSNMEPAGAPFHCPTPMSLTVCVRVWVYVCVYVQ